MAEAGREPLRVLFVCTANICRSPTAEHLARLHAGPAPLVAQSAGFLRSGVPCPPHLVRVLGDRGVDLSGHRSRSLTPEIIAQSDLIATMEVQHVREVATIEPSALGRTVPLLELDRLLHGPSDLSTVMDLLAARDPRAYLGTGSSDDVPDPYGRSRRQYRRAVDLIDQVVGRLVRNLVR